MVGSEAVLVGRKQVVRGKVSVQLFGNYALGDFGYGSKNRDRSITTEVAGLSSFRNGVHKSEFPGVGDDTRRNAVSSLGDHWGIKANIFFLENKP